MDRHAHEEDESHGGQGEGDGEERLPVRLGPGVRVLERGKGLADRDDEQDEDDIAGRAQGVAEAPTSDPSPAERERGTSSLPFRRQGLFETRLSGCHVVSRRAPPPGCAPLLHTSEGADEQDEEEVDGQIADRDQEQQDQVAAGVLEAQAPQEGEKGQDQRSPGRGVGEASADGRSPERIANRGQAEGGQGDDDPAPLHHDVDHQQGQRDDGE